MSSERIRATVHIWIRVDRPYPNNQGFNPSPISNHAHGYNPHHYNNFTNHGHHHGHHGHHGHHNQGFNPFPSPSHHNHHNHNHHGGGHHGGGHHGGGGHRHHGHWFCIIYFVIMPNYFIRLITQLWLSYSLNF